ncbi:MAG: restriction endonuclease subunit S [Proteobacteria bacterium]|nr:restriction endonuclease subunit S [Pseudomonadota bacterium]MBU4298336.1 restriction endonuclease subunit S [Pseudomonadota bacterium]MCG2749840.1 restriction endonuclease subunit S [Desulfobulbaceae bacterium]
MSLTEKHSAKRHQEGFDEIMLGDAVTFQRGFDITKKEQKEGKIPIVSSSGVSSFHKQFKVKGPGVVIGRKGTLGTVHYLRENYWPHDTTLWVKDFKGNDQRLIYYFLQTLRLENFDAGSSNPTLNRNHVHKIKVVFPKLGLQKKIAAILSAYDDLIENNKRRIGLLEKMAEEIYCEWFVRFRFPGHEQVKMVKGVPEGWAKVPLKKAFTYTGGGTPAKEVERFWKDGDVNWYTPSDITASQGVFLSRSADQCTEEGLSRSSARLFPAYSIMMTSRATIGAIGINTTPACTNQGFITCIPNERYHMTFLYHWLKLSKPHFELLSGGATFAELTKGTFKRIEILTPPKELVGDFENRVLSMFKQIELLLKQIDGLAKIRGMLLPRLISGKLPVENLNIHFPPGMAEDGEGDVQKSAHG